MAKVVDVKKVVNNDNSTFYQEAGPYYAIYDDQGNCVRKLAVNGVDFLSVSDGIAKFKYNVNSGINPKVKAGMTAGVNSFGDLIAL